MWHLSSLNVVLTITYIFHCLFENIPVAESHLFTDGLFWAMLERYVKLGCILSTLIKT